MNALAVAASFLLCALVLWLLLRADVARFLLDHPNARSLHAKPVPRVGGIGIMVGLTAGMALAGGPRLVLLLALTLMLLSIVDDWRDLPAGVRLLGHLGVAAVFVLVTGETLGPFALALVLAVAWITNLYNFMDGADGLAGGMAVFGFGAYALAAWSGGQPAFAAACLAIAAAALAFLLFNFPPARLFMGDAGSVPLGFLAGAMGLNGWQRELWPLWFPLVAFAPFVVDATVTLFRRLLRGERVWQAHRSHYYQRQVLMGWTHRRLALAEYALMALSALVGSLAIRADGVTAGVLLAGLAGLYAAGMVMIDVRWARRSTSNA